MARHRAEHRALRSEARNLDHEAGGQAVRAVVVGRREVVLGARRIVLDEAAIRRERVHRAAEGVRHVAEERTAEARAYLGLHAVVRRTSHVRELLEAAAAVESQELRRHEEVGIDEASKPVVDVGEPVHRRHARIDRARRGSPCRAGRGRASPRRRDPRRRRGAVRTARSSSTAEGSASRAAGR